MRTLAPSSLLTAVLAATLPGQRVVLDLRGIPADTFGAAVAGVGDVDLDGWPDLLVGAPGANQGAGRVELRSGRDGRVLLSHGGAAVGDRLGQRVGRLGDVDRDGRPDLLASGAHEVLALSGAGGAVLLRLASFRACGAGDADGDGWADLAVARPIGPSPGDEVAVISGRTGATIARFALPVGETLTAMDGAGDADADGRDDLVLGFSRGNASAGRAWVLSPARAALLWSWSTPDDSGYVLGQAVAGCGDFDGDGHADVAVGVYETSLVNRTGGEITVYSGRTGAVLGRLLGSHWQGHLYATYFKLYGEALAGGGDLDGDGRPDLLAYEWATDSTPRLRSWTGPRVAPAASSFAFCGDVDRDGFDDIVVGDAARGSVQVVAGPGGSTVRELEWPGAPLQEWDSALLGVRSIGDQNGDGVRDLLVARMNGASIGGPVYHTVVVSGRDGAELSSVLGTGGFRLFATLATLGDIDGDQREDWAVVWYPDLLQVVGSQTGVRQMWSPSSSFGSGLAGGADWSGDGRSDVFLGAELVAGGTVEVRSGADFSLVFTLTGTGGGFGHALCVLDDVDRDGIDDLLVAAPTEAGTGILRLIGSADRSVRWSVPSAAAVLLALPDQNGDGVLDFAVPLPGAGQIEVRSGADGSLLRRLALAGFAPVALEGGTDVDGDGVVDLVVGDPDQSRARILSGADGRTLLDLAGYPDGLGAGVGWIGVVDGAARTAAMSARGGTYSRGYVRLFRDDAGHARVVRFGLGCRTALPAPDLTLSAPPVLGTVVQVEMRALAPGAPAALLAGVSDAAFAGVPLPLGLAGLGAPACVLWTSVEVAVPFLPAAAAVVVPWALPDDPALIGGRAFAQLLQLDPDLTLRASAGLRIGLGR